MATQNEERAFIVPSFDGGMQRRSSIFQDKLNELRLGKNIDLQHMLGAVSKALGYTQLGSAIGGSGSVLGAGALNTAGGTDKLVAFVGTDAYVYNSATEDWDAQSRSYTAAQSFETESFLDQLFVVNGLTDAPENYTGAAWSTTTNVTDMPKSKTIKRHKERLYLFNINIPVGGNFPSRVWYSDLPKNNALTWGFESGTDLAQTADSAVVTSAAAVFETRNIKVGDPFFITTGTNAGEYEVESIDSETQITLTETLTNTQTSKSFWVGGNWFDVARDNSDVGKGLEESSGRMLCFKRFSLHKFLKTDDVATDQLDPVKGVPGTTSQRGIISIKGWTFYPADSGVWRYDGAESKMVSNPIKEVWDGITAANLLTIVAWAVDDRLIKMYVGDVDNSDTGLTINKCVIVHDPIANTWWVESLADTFNCAVRWVDSTTLKRFAFTDTGKCLQTENGNDFDDEAIDMELETPFYFPISPEVSVNITRFKVFTHEGRAISYEYKLAYYKEKGGYVRDEDWKPLEEKDKTKDEVNLALDEKDNKASGFALKAVDSSAKGRPSILRIVAYYSGGEVR